MNALVVGYGSIGARHVRILREEGSHVGVVSRRALDEKMLFSSVAEGLREHRPDYVVVANRTVEHRDTVAELATAGFRGTVLVEKPLFATATNIPQNAFAKLLVAYNLRFHPGVQALQRAIEGERVISVQAYVGQHLSTWRPGRNYREVYSASKAAGGGVLRDLSHELDLVNWIFGGWVRLAALGGRLSSLDIDSDDTAVLLAAFQRCPAVSIQLNYLDRPGRRSIIVNTDKRTVDLNMTGGYIEVNGERTDFTVDADETYRAQHHAILNGEADTVCTADEAVEVMALIAATERAMNSQTWVCR